MKNLTTEEYYTPYQLKLPLEISKIIDADDPVCTFSEVMDHIDLRKFFAGKGIKMGRPRCDAEKLLKIILFAFMEGGYSSLRELEKRCKTDIRYMWLLDEMKAPSLCGTFLQSLILYLLNVLAFQVFPERLIQQGTDHEAQEHIDQHIAAVIQCGVQPR